MNTTAGRRTRSHRTVGRGRGVTRRSGSSRGRRRRASSRASNDSIELMENDEPEVLVTRETGPGGEGGVCIDLTEDTDDSIVDLTNADTPITLRRRPTIDLREQLSPRQRRQRNRDTEEMSDEELPDLPPFVCGSTSPSRRKDEATAAAPSGLSVTSPPSKFTCPVCLEDDKQIRRAGKKLYSTVCGHLFCEECIRSVIQTQRKCPTCRKTLSNRSVHPIYL